jgi:hypothetical protein
MTASTAFDAKEGDTSFGNGESGSRGDGVTDPSARLAGATRRCLTSLTTTPPRISRN